MTSVGRQGREAAAAAPRRPAVAAADERYLRFIATSLFLGLALGFVLAALLPLARAFEAQWGLRWQALAQVHGHVQVVGFAGFFIVGMGYRLVPRFSGTPIRNGWTVTPVYGLLVAGLALRVIGQPLADTAALSWLPAAAALCELAGACLFALTVLPTLLKPLRGRQPWAGFLAAGVVWFVVQAALGVWLMTDLPLHGGLRGLPAGQTVLPPDRDQLLLSVQVYGFLLNFIFGVASRAVPTFFGFRPPRALLLAAWALLQVGVMLVAAAALLTIWRGSEALSLQSLGLICLGVSLIAFAASTGSWKPATRLRPSARPVAIFLSLAFLCCALAGLLECWFGLHDWVVDGRLMAGTDADAVRHLLTVGVVTTLIVGMAHLVVPALATQRLTGRSVRRRLLLLQAALAAAVALRVAPVMMSSLDGRLRDGLIGAAGVLAWLAIALFAFSLRRAYREQATVIQPIAHSSG